jgi:nuclear pore complex protein Nup53
VFGYPPDKYSIAVEYFRQFGDITEPEPSNEVTNAFRVGYRLPTDAMRAIRKNGEVIGGSWMIGAKWEVRRSWFCFCFHPG